MKSFLFCEKYRPQTISETILPERLKTQFQQYVDAKDFPTLILCGTSGIGKTTVAKALCNEIGADSYLINGSLSGNIDTLRVEIMQFASTVSMNGGRKYVILDEADNLTRATQLALRNFMEEYESNCGFILTCNYPHKIIDALHSRASVVYFKFKKEEVKDIKGQMAKRAVMILKKEGIEYDAKAVLGVINRYYPDYRRSLMELQAYASLGKIDAGILGNSEENDFKLLLDLMKEKNFTSVRTWITENAEGLDTEIFDKFYNDCSKYFDSASIPVLVQILAKYQYQAAFVANREINLAACFADVMGNCQFKN